MPTLIGHGMPALAVSMVIPRRLSRAIILLGLACSIAPDLDLVGFYLGVPYAHWLGHRGLSHSLCFSLLTAGLCYLIFVRLTGKASERGRLFLSFLLCAVSHPILDGLTDGGYGVALLSPFSNERYFLPWQPLPVAPLGLGELAGPDGLAVLLHELLWIVLPSAAAAIYGLRANQERSRNTPN